MMISGGVVTNIDDPKGPTLCRAINSSNQIVGDYFDTSGNPHGFLYSDGTFTDIPGPTKAVVSEATGINDAGVISGDYWDTVTQTFHGFILKSGTYKTLDPPGTVSTLGGGINANDDVTLWWHDRANHRQSSLYNGTTYVSINVPGATNSLAYGVNKTNEVVFVWTDSYLAKHGAVKQGSAYYIFDFPKGNTTRATGINDLGEFVGSFIPAGKTTDQPLEGNRNQAI
jgi:probable HAF family extracellular repeat protein